MGALSTDRSLHSGERQVAPTLDGIRPDHVERYRLAARYVTPGINVLDCACGVGYGSVILAGAGAQSVTGLDISQAAIDYAREHYSVPEPLIDPATGQASGPQIVYQCGVAPYIPCLHPIGEKFHLVASLETLEHVEDDYELLTWIHYRMAPDAVLVCSVPNVKIYPDPHANLFHVRHYSPAQFLDLLEQAGFGLLVACSQTDNLPALNAGWLGGTLIAVCRRM
jgi:2-polyprenyl-3-methyl-5-hydroxy-6-metoxy-1,4-benzoquinol methylase